MNIGVDRTDYAARASLEARLLRRSRPAADAIPVLPRGAGELRFRASVSQEGMWGEMGEGHEPAPMIVGGAHLRGPLDVSAFIAAWNAVAARHETLRSTLRVEHGQLTQVVAPEAWLDVPVVPIDADGWAEYSRREVDRPLDPSTGPLARLTLLRTAPEEHVVLVLLHHLIGDGRTVEVLIRDLAACYVARLAGTAAELPPLPVQYADFAAWHRARLAGARGEELRTYWVGRLAGARPAILPTDLPTPAHPSAYGDTVTVPVPRALFDAYRECARRASTTLYTVGCAAFAVYLSRASGQRDISLRAPVSYRDRSELANLIADFSNDVIVRLDLSGNPTFTDLVARTRHETTADFAHHDLPPHLLEPHLDEPTLLARLFHVQFTAEREALTQLRLGDLTVEPMTPPWQYALRPLSVRIRYADDGTVPTCLATYRTDRFSDQRAEQVVHDYLSVLDELVTHPDRTVLG